MCVVNLTTLFIEVDPYRYDELEDTVCNNERIDHKYKRGPGSGLVRLIISRLKRVLQWF